jgi:hypothetical protein
VAVGAVLPGALATLAGEIGTDLGRQVFREDISGVGVMFGKKEHAMSATLLGWVGSTIAARLLLALGGSRFYTLIWGGRIMLHIGALILVALSGRAEAEI